MWRFTGFLVAISTTFGASPAPHSRTPEAKVQSIRLFRIIAKDKYGFTDATGRTIIEPQFYFAGDFSEGLAPFAMAAEKATKGTLVDGKWKRGEPWKPEAWGYIDTSGKVIVEPAYAKTHNLSDEMGLVESAQRKPDGTVSRLYGYVNRFGKVAIKPQFAHAFPFSEGLAVATRSTELVSSQTGAGPTNVVSGVRYGYIDRTGRFVVSERLWHRDFQPPKAFHDGLAQVGPLTFIDREGRIAIDLKPTRNIPNSTDRYSYATSRMTEFSEGLSRISYSIWRADPRRPGGFVGSSWLSCYVDKRAEMVLQGHYTGVRAFSEGLAAVAIEVKAEVGNAAKWGYIDRSGKMVVKAEYDVAGDFSEGLAYVSTRDGLRGYIDKAGKIVFQVPARFRGLNPPGGRDWSGDELPDRTPAVLTLFREGLAGSPYGYIDRTGKVVWEADTRRR